MPFEGPIVVDPDVAALKAVAGTRDARCTCDRSPFCRDQASADWATCSTACRACKRPPSQPPIQPGRGALDADQS
jgi:hypothetical protein